MQTPTSANSCAGKTAVVIGSGVIAAFLAAMFLTNGLSVLISVLSEVRGDKTVAVIDGLAQAQNAA